MRVILVTTVCCALAWCGCTDSANSRQAAQDDEDAAAVAALISRIGEIDVRQREGETNAARYDRMYRAIDGLTASLKSPETLKALFYACQEVCENRGPTPQERLDEPDPCWRTQQAILFRLADIGGEGSAEVLVALLADDRLSWDGEGGLNIGMAITMCGKPCLPPLKALASNGDRGPFAKRLAEYITAGKVMTR